MDEAALLAPLGGIPDATERRAVLADLLDDLLVPLGHARHAVRACEPVVRPVTSSSTVRGAPASTDLGVGRPGRRAARPGRAAPIADFHFRDAVRLGGRGRGFALDVAGGLAGLLVDLRDVPMRLPDRADSRREQLRAWQAAVRPGGHA